MTFGEQLLRERKRLGLTQPEAAKLLSMPFRTYWAWESGELTPHILSQEGALARLKARKPKP